MSAVLSSVLFSDDFFRLLFALLLFEGSLSEFGVFLIDFDVVGFSESLALSYTLVDEPSSEWDASESLERRIEIFLVRFGG